MNGWAILFFTTAAFTWIVSFGLFLASCMALGQGRKVSYPLIWPFVASLFTAGFLIAL